MYIFNNVHTNKEQLNKVKKNGQKPHIVYTKNVHSTSLRDKVKALS